MSILNRSNQSTKAGRFPALSDRHAKPSLRSALMAGATRFITHGLIFSLMLPFNPAAYALPSGGTVLSGSATIVSTANKVTVTETSAKAVISWTNFSIGTGQSVQFVQLNSSSTLLDLVAGPNPSTILGSMSANGQVFLVNPNGISFGKNAQVNVGALVASTLDISSGDFMAGRYTFSGDSVARIVNQGTITAASGGYVALLGANVNNAGVISAKLGTVVLAAGSAMTLDLAGDGLLNVAVDSGTVNALVQNGGLIRADGGQVVLTARAAGALLSSAVNNTGVIEAQTLENHDGIITLQGDPQYGTVTVAGTLDVSGKGAGQTGGTVQILGQTVDLAGAKISASGDAGGGTVMIGGAPHGAGPQPNSETASVDSATTINADAVTSGNGGQITVWSNGTTSVAGTLTANGGANSGDGGTIETSGHSLVFTGAKISAAAPKGQDGTWLLDPFDLQIDAGAANTIVAVLAGSTNVTLQTFAAGAPSGAGNSVSGPGDITVLSTGSMTWSTTAMLTMNAFNSVTIGAAITTTGGHLVLIAGTDVDINAAITTTSGSLAMTAGNNVNISAAVTTTTGSLTALAGNNIDISTAVTTTDGPMVLISGNNGLGLGTVIDTGPRGAVTGPTASVNIYYNPTSYGSPTDYSGNFTLTGGATLNSYMEVSLKGNNKVYDGTTAATLSLYGSPDPADVTITAGTATFDTKDVGNGKTITYSGYSMTGQAVTYNGKTITETLPAQAVLVGASDYTGYALVTQTGTTTGNITPAPLTVTANSTTKAFGTTITFAGTEFTSAGLVNNETIGSVTLTSPGAAPTATVAGSPYAITPSAATGGSFLASDYAITYVNGAITMHAAVLDITANSTSKIYGTTITFAGTEFTSTGLENGQTIGSVTLTSPGASPTASVAGSPYAITPSAATGGTFIAADYTIVYTNGAMTVHPAVLDITANNATKAFGTTLTFAGTEFTSTGLVNGQSIGSVTLTSPGAAPAATVAGSPYAITPSAATGGSFVPADYTITYFNGAMNVVHPVILDITANNASKTYGTTITFAGTEFTSTGLINGETIGSVTLVSPGAAPTASVAGSPYVIVPSAATGGTFVPAEYTIVYINGAMTVHPAPLNITANNASKVYGSTVVFAGTEFTSTGLENGETIDSVTLTSPGAVSTASVAGSPYAITPSAATGSTFVPADYAINYVNGILTVAGPGGASSGGTAATTIYNSSSGLGSSPLNPILAGLNLSVVNRPPEVMQMVAVMPPQPVPQPVIIAPPPARVPYVAPWFPPRLGRN